MPQMAPISWLILFLIFTITFILFNILNYYCFNKSTSHNNENTNNKMVSNQLSWKW